VKSHVYKKTLTPEHPAVSFQINNQAPHPMQRGVEMKHGITRVAFVVLLADGFIWITCSSDRPVDSEGNVNNTDFVPKESFCFRVDVTTHSRLRLDGVSGTVTIAGEPESVLITGERRVGSESTQDAEADLPLLQVSVREKRQQIVHSSWLKDGKTDS
jgi:hypothetical protein